MVKEFHPFTSDFLDSLKRRFSTSGHQTEPATSPSPETPVAVTQPQPPVPLSELHFEQFNYPQTQIKEPTSVKGAPMAEINLHDEELKPVDTTTQRDNALASDVVSRKIEQRNHPQDVWSAEQFTMHGTRVENDFNSLKKQTVGRAEVLDPINEDTEAEAIVRALEVEGKFDRCIFVMGGAKGLDETKTNKLTQLITEGLSRIAVDAQGRILVGDGGTESGIMDMDGEARKAAQAAGSDMILLGVAPKLELKIAAGDQVYYDGPGSDTAIEDWHSHILPVESKENNGKGYYWGDETIKMYEIFKLLAKDKLSLGLMVNGGDITLHEVVENMKQGRTVVVLKGSGRAAEGVAALVENRLADSPEDIQGFAKKFQELAGDQLEQWKQQLTVFDLNTGSVDDFVNLFRDRLNLAEEAAGVYQEPQAQPATEQRTA